MNLIQVLTTPRCWLQNDPYSSVWDSVLLSLMETETFKKETDFTARIGNVVVWIGNHPYASFTPMAIRGVRPSRGTILKAHDKLVRDTLLHNQKISGGTSAASDS